MINPANKNKVLSILDLISEWESDPEHFGLTRDVYDALRTIINSEGHLCPECKMPAEGISRDCLTCAQRRPRMYELVYGRR